jgi:hypothetical protein
MAEILLKWRKTPNQSINHGSMTNPGTVKNRHTAGSVHPTPPIRKSNQLPTPIKVSQLAQYLEGYYSRKVRYLLDGFSNGFSLAFEGDRGFQSNPNLKSALEKPDIVLNKIRRVNGR